MAFKGDVGEKDLCTGFREGGVAYCGVHFNDRDVFSEAVAERGKESSIRGGMMEGKARGAKGADALKWEQEGEGTCGSI